MTEKHPSASGTGSPRAGDGQRIQAFSVAGPIKANLTSRSGDVSVRTGRHDELLVTLSVDSSKYHYLLETARIDFDPLSNRLEVRTQTRDHDGPPRGKAGKLRLSWFDFGGSDLDVLVVLPEGSSLEVKTVSGDTSLEGPFGAVSVSSVSGDVDVADPCDVVDVRTASGDVSVNRVSTTLKCRSASGDVECRSCAATTDVTSASGDVNVMADQPGQVTVKTVSGDIQVRVARGLVVDVDANSVSGELGTNIDLDAPGSAGSDEEPVYVKAATVSGDIRVDKAW